MFVVKGRAILEKKTGLEEKTGGENIYRDKCNLVI